MAGNLKGLLKERNRKYIWLRYLNGKAYKCGLGTDRQTAERIVPDLSHLKPPKPKKGVKPAFDWLP